MKKNNQKKNDLLGMSHGTASHRLRKEILFSLVCKLGENICYRCNEKIETVSEISIEHKQSWQSSSEPIKTFFDLDNIAFSHLRCNIYARSIPQKRCFTQEQRKHRDNEIERNSWNRLTKEEQKKRRREKYLRNGC